MIDLPYPPTANNLFINAKRGGRVKSPEYRAWCEAAAWAIKLQKPEPVAGKFRLTMLATRPDRRRRDCTNLIKATEDALVANGLIEDDSLAESVFIGWAAEPPRKDATIRVWIEADVQTRARAA